MIKYERSRGMWIFPCTVVRSLAEAGTHDKRFFGCSHSKAPLGCIEYLVSWIRRFGIGHWSTKLIIALKTPSHKDKPAHFRFCKNSVQILRRQCCLLPHTNIASAKICWTPFPMKASTCVDTSRSTKDKQLLGSTIKSDQPTNQPTHRPINQQPPSGNHKIWPRSISAHLYLCLYGFI